MFPVTLTSQEQRPHHPPLSGPGGEHPHRLSSHPRHSRHLETRQPGLQCRDHPGRGAAGGQPTAGCVRGPAEWRTLPHHPGVSNLPNFVQASIVSLNPPSGASPQLGQSPGSLQTEYLYNSSLS